MKKVLWSITAATLIILAGCANTAATTQPEDRLPPPAVESVLEPDGPVESGTVDNTTVEDEAEATTEPEPQAEPPAASQPQEPQASVQISVTFVPDSKKEAVENSTPAPSESPQETPQTPKPEPTPSAPPAELEQSAEPVPPAASEPPEPTEPTFSIDYWIGYAQECAKSVGLNLDSTAVDCWDNPITAGAHCTYLERDIQSRLNRYAGDETILDVWVWAESRSDGNYDLYIGYA